MKGPVVRSSAVEPRDTGTMSRESQHPAPRVRTPPDPLRARRARDHVRSVAAGVVAVIGVVGLVSSISPPLRRRVHLVLDVLPMPVPRTAATTLVLVSIALLLTARGLRRGQRLAWWGTLALLTASVVLHLAKGLDVEEAFVAALGGAWLATRGRSFQVLPTRAALHRAVVLGALGAVVVGGISVALTRLPPHGPHDPVEDRLDPMLTAAGVGLVVAAAWVLLSPRTPSPQSPAQRRVERERARAVVERYGGGTLDVFALRDDKSWFFTGRSVVAHVVRGGVCLVSPDPIGPPDERVEVWAELLAYADRHGWSVAVLGAGPQWLPIYEACGLRTVYLGDEAVVDCPSFTLAGSSRRSLRQAVARVARAGYTTTFHDPAHLAPDLVAELEALSTESRRGEAERGFSMTLSRLFDPADAGFLLSLTRDAHGRVDAFVHWVPARDVDGWSLDVMRRRTDTDVPNGLVDACIVATIQEVARRGQHGLALNFAVMRTVLDGEREGRLADLSRPVLSQISDRTQMASLSRFNEKFGPTWSPRYVVLDSVEYVAAQGVVIADAEGITELPVIGRFLGRGT